MVKKKIVKVTMSKEGVHTVYVALPEHPKEICACVERTILLDDVIDGFNGPRVHLDFNQDGVLIGIEILV